MDAYIDDIVVKSKKMEEHIRALEDMFGVLRKYKIKLNHERSVFRVITGKF